MTIRSLTRSMSTNPYHLARRLSKRLFAQLCAMMHRDHITFRAVVPRDDMTHIGTKYGGWVVPREQLNAQSICYCVGCGEDISFDLGLIDQIGCKVFAFDPTPRAIEYVKQVAGKNSAYNFFELGLWNKEDVLKFYAPKNAAHVSHSLVNLQGTKEYIEVKVQRLKWIMANQRHTKLDLLKLDIEGAEYQVLDSIFEDQLDIKIICVEFDEYQNPLDAGATKRIATYVGKLLDSGYQIINSSRSGNYTFLKNDL